MPKDALLAVLAAIDVANAADPNSEPDGRPAALVYGERMSEELARRSPDASEHLQIAARGQHVERWKIARLTIRTGAPAIFGGGLTRPVPTPSG